MASRAVCVAITRRLNNHAGACMTITTATTDGALAAPAHRLTNGNDRVVSPAIRPLIRDLGCWLPVARRDREVLALLGRYGQSWLGAYHDLWIGKEHLVLLAPQGDAVCAWSVPRDPFVPGGVELAVLHNESRRPLWRMLGEAARHARAVWPEKPRYAILNARHRSARTTSFEIAGWKRRNIWSTVWRDERSR